MTETTSACDRYPLHRAVFEGNLRKVSSLLREHDIGKKDCHGKFHFNFLLYRTQPGQCLCFIFKLAFHIRQKSLRKLLTVILSVFVNLLQLQ
jgi:hypothetical protein